MLDIMNSRWRNNSQQPNVSKITSNLSLHQAIISGDKNYRSIIQICRQNGDDLILVWTPVR